jgi:hypothetical protein
LRVAPAKVDTAFSQAAKLKAPGDITVKPKTLTPAQQSEYRAELKQAASALAAGLRAAASHISAGGTNTPSGVKPGGR